MNKFIRFCISEKFFLSEENFLLLPHMGMAMRVFFGGEAGIGAEKRPSRLSCVRGGSLNQGFCQRDDVQQGIGFCEEQCGGLGAGLILVGDHDGKAACPVSGDDAGDFYE